MNTRTRFLRFALGCLFLLGIALQTAAATVVSNLTAAQRPGTALVDIGYNLQSPGHAAVTVTLEASGDGGATWTLPVTTVSGDVGSGVAPGAGRAIVWDAGADWPGNISDQVRFRVTAEEQFALIPGGEFTMGRTAGDTDINAPPVTVMVSSFYLYKTEVTKAQWNKVRIWGVANGYADLPSGNAKEWDHPVYSISWFDAVKWCNAFSEMQGLTPCYKVGENVLRSGTTVPDVDWSADGYRLPTEAEWEKAARGGISGKRFPWGGDTIDHSWANYAANSSRAHDISGYATDTYHPDYEVGEVPYTAPVARFAANGFGLHDMAGNVFEWCSDWYAADSYAGGVTDPRGAESGDERILRGGGWNNGANRARACDRHRRLPTDRISNVGFRIASLSTSVATQTMASNVALDINLPQTLSFAPIPDQLTTASVPLVATGGGSGNPVAFVVTEGPAVINDNVLTFTGAGSVTVTASQAGTLLYLPAEDVSHTFTVTKAVAAVTFAERLQVDDGTPRPVSFTTDPVDLPFALSYDDSATVPSLPGHYAVAASLDNPIYSGSGSTTLTLLGLSGRGQRLTSGSTEPQEANGTDFGRVLPGRVATQTFTLRNPGPVPVALTGNPVAELLGEHAGDFQISLAPAAEIPAGGSVSFEVRFAPTQPGARQALVRLACEALANGPITFAIGGHGALPSLLPQTIAFPLPASVFLSQGPLPVVASASSGLPVTLSVLSGPATLEDGLLQLNEPGIVKIEARQAGGGNFVAAKPVVRSLTVRADPAGLTLADLTQTYTGTPRPITVLGTEEEATVTYVIDKQPSETAPTNAGSYPVTVVAGGVTKKGKLVISRAPLIVQVQDQRRLLGQANPELTVVLSGFLAGDTQESVLFRPISVTTQAKPTSPPGLYPITSSGGAALNYTLLHRPGTLVVEGHVGNFEALLRDPDSGAPVGLLKLTVPTSGRSASASLMLGEWAKPLALAGPLVVDEATRSASAQWRRTVTSKDGVTGEVLTDDYALNFTLSPFGELQVEVAKNEQLLAQSEDGARLREIVKGTALPQAGAYTAVLEPAEDDAAPSAPGWATAKVDANGRMSMTGRLGDGTAFTASLPVDLRGEYRLFVQPYKRAGAHLGGAWSLREHPQVAETWQARQAVLVWVKGGHAKDPGYRAGFGPLEVELEMDPWQPANKATTLAQLLGAEQLGVSYDATGSPSEAQLPSTVALDRSNRLLVQAPVTNPPNLRKWTAKVNPATGSFTGSFELLDVTQKRKVTFSGVLRQAADAEGDGLQGRGQFLLPPLKGADTTETPTGRLEFRRVPE
jgi:formylglycine-generating enzyme required for sulfatase activity